MKEKRLFFALACLISALMGGGNPCYLNASVGVLNTPNTTPQAILTQETDDAAVETGYYYIVSNYSTFSDAGLTKAMFARKNVVNWETLDKTDATQIWLITALEDGNYSIQNYGTSTYIGSLSDRDYNGPLPLTSSLTTEQVITVVDADNDIYNIVCEGCSYYYFAHGADNTLVTQRVAMAYVTSGSSIGGDAWKLVKATDSDLNRIKLATAIKNAENAYDHKAFDCEALITDASQIAANAENTSWGSRANLIDGNNNTIFHTSDDTSLGIGWFNLQFTLASPVKGIKLYFRGRDAGTNYSYSDTPNHVVLYGTNDETLGTSTTASESEQWTQLADLQQPDYALPDNVDQLEYSSPAIDFGGTAYKYIRFEVRGTTTGRKSNDEMAMFNLAELQMYNTDPDALSLGYTVPAMTTVAAALQEAITAAQAKFADTEAEITSADISAIEEATAAVEALYAANETLRAEGVSTDDMATATELTISAATLTSTTTSALQTLVNTNAALTSIDLDAVYTRTPFALDPANPNLVIYDKNSCVTNTTNVVRPGSDGTSLVCASLVITDGYPFGVMRDFTATDVSYDRTFLGTGDTYYSTTCLPFTIAKDKVSGLSSLLSFKSLNLDAGMVMLDDAETLEAGTPYVVTVSTAQPFLSLTGVNVAVKAGAPADVTVEDASFCGTYVTLTDKATSADEAVYGFSGGQFVKVGEGCTFNPFRCYITVTTSDTDALPSSLNLDPSGGTVGIGSVKAQKDAATVYTTDGVLLGTFDDASAAAAYLPAGIYIINGKKTLVK